MKNFVIMLTCSALAATLPVWGQESGDAQYEELRYPHFIVHYDRQVEQSYATRVADKAERLYFDITEEFSFVRDNFWTWDNRAHIYIAPDKNAYGKRFKCASWSEACVDYVGKTIYTYCDQDKFDSLMAHEMTHIIFNEYIGASKVPIWFNEGLAVYIQEKYGGAANFPDVHAAVGEIIKANRYFSYVELCDITDTNVQKLSGDKARIFYIEAFSLVDFFVQKYGRDGVRYFFYLLRDGKDFNEAMRLGLVDPAEVEAKWKQYYTE